jgi:uncharacterized protein involved in cysteine biosynthesis
MNLGPKILLSPKRKLGLSVCFFAPLSGALYLLQRPKMLGIAVFPVVFSICLFLLLLWGGYEYAAQPLLDKIQINNSVVDSIVWWVAGLSLMFAMLLVSSILMYLLIIPISAPFCDMISELIEREYFEEYPELKAPSKTIWEGIRHSIIDGIKRVLLFSPVLLILIFSGWIPIVGPLVGVVLSVVYNAFFLSMDAFSYCLDRRSLGIRAKFAFLNGYQHVRFPLGFGLVFLLLIPCNVFFLPLLSAVAGTRLYCVMKIREKLAPSGD